MFTTKSLVGFTIQQTLHMKILFTDEYTFGNRKTSMHLCKKELALRLTDAYCMNTIDTMLLIRYVYQC